MVDPNRIKSGHDLLFRAQLPQMAIAICSANIINGIFSFWQEFKAEKATVAMRRMLPRIARVVRDGSVQ